jgi:hypothetical protein
MGDFNVFENIAGDDAAEETKSLYHFTDPQAAQDIWDSRRMKSNDESLPYHAFFTTDPNSEYGKGFGESVVKVNIPQSYLNSNFFEGWRDDAFDNGEEHWTVPLDDFERNPHWIERPEGYRRKL